MKDGIGAAMLKLKTSILWLDKNLEEVLVVITLLSMTILIFGQTLLRFTIGKTPSWTQELAQFIQVYFVYIGAIYAIKEDAHIRITLLGKKLSKPLQKPFNFIGLSGFLLFCLVITIWGSHLCLEIKRFNQLSAAMQLPMFIPYLAVPLGGFAMSVRLIQKIIKLYKSEDLETQ